MWAFVDSLLANDEKIASSKNIPNSRQECEKTRAYLQSKWLKLMRYKVSDQHG